MSAETLDEFRYLESTVLNPETRPSLIVRLSSGQDQSAWWAFVEIYEPFLHHLVKRQGIPHDHAADAVQQILIAISRSVDGWQDDGNEASFRRWLRRVSRNVVIKFMTRVRRQSPAIGGSEFLASLDQQPSPPDETLQQQFDHELIVWAARRVQKDFAATSWQAFWETMIEGSSVEEVSKRLGVSAGSIYMSRARILARIRTVIDEVTQ